MDEDRQRWNARYGRGSHQSSAPVPFLVAQADRLPVTGSALDVAGGAGRHALWLAARGLTVTVADISDVGLDLAKRRAAARGLSIETRALDLEAETPAGPWDAIVSVHYLQRSLFQVFPRILAPGGVLVFVQPTTTNLERHAKPSRRFLLEAGELEQLVIGLAIEHLEKSWPPDGFHEARLVARAPA